MSSVPAEAGIQQPSSEERYSPILDTLSLQQFLKGLSHLLRRLRPFQCAREMKRAKTDSSS